MDRLTSLTAFVHVVENGGFSAAARRLNMSTTMVSNHIQALEDRLGVRLLNRTTRKVSLTDVGADYYERCTQILEELEDAETVAGAQQSTPRGKLCIYSSAHIMRFIAPVVAEFLGCYPEVTIDLAVGERMIDMIEERVDIAIRTTPPPDSSLIVRHLVNWRLILCCSPEYKKKIGEPKALAELTTHNCLRFEYYPFGDEWRFEGPDGKPASVRVSGNFISSSGEALRIAALAGRGLFLGPDFVIFEDIANRKLVPVLTGYRPVEFKLNAIYPHRRHLPAKVRAFLDLLSSRIAEHWSIIGRKIGR
jgi:DNA-binding transcriptional LysR family regulator